MGIHVTSEEMQEWRKILDPDYDYKSIVFRYPIIFSSHSTLLKIVACIVFISGIPLILVTILYAIDVIGVWSYGYTFMITEFSFCVVVTIIAAVIFQTLLKYNDKYYFNKQSKYIIVSGFVFMLAYAFNLLLSVDPFFLVIMQCWALTCIPLTFWIWSILYPVYLIYCMKKNTNDINTNHNHKSKNNKTNENNKNSVEKTKETRLSDYVAGTKMTVDRQSSSRNNDQENELVKVLSHPIGFESFMEHLRSEFAGENLLFVVYVIQFQMFLIESKIAVFMDKIGSEIENQKNSHSTNSIECKPFVQKIWILPQNVPKSSIFATKTGKKLKDGNKSNINVSVQSFSASASSRQMSIEVVDEPGLEKSILETLKNTRVLDMVQVIFTKFVEQGHAPLEINISHQNRAKITSCYFDLTKSDNMTNHQTMECFHQLWDGLRIAALECWQLMSYSAARFKAPQAMQQ